MLQSKNVDLAACDARAVAAERRAAGERLLVASVATRLCESKILFVFLRDSHNKLCKTVIRSRVCDFADIGTRLNEEQRRALMAESERDAAIKVPR